LIEGVDTSSHPLRWRIDRIASIAEDRQREALVLPLSVTDNLLLKEYRKPRFRTSYPLPQGNLGWLRFGAWRQHAVQLVRQFDIRTPSIRTNVGRLSGGNQQKVVLARELHADQGQRGKPIVLAVNPTRGLDVGATAFVMQTLLDARDRGAAILLIHSDLDELLAISDRVLTLFNGTLSPTRPPAGPTPPRKPSVG
jgi:simple sugar transport system ATP-binding protein